MENLIVIEGKDKKQYKTLKGFIKDFISENYFDMSEEEKKQTLEKKAIANKMFSNVKIEKENYTGNEFFIKDEITYILSLLKNNKIVLLERTDAHIFGRFINTNQIKDNYIILNKFADDIMKKYIRSKTDKERE